MVENNPSIYSGSFAGELCLLGVRVVD